MNDPVSKIFFAFDHVFDRVFGSKYNPLHHSGTLTIAFFGLMIISGIYLFLFYDVSAPYDAVANLDSQIWSGRWIRSLHHYAADAALISTLFHALKMFAQKKTWGPRFFGLD